MEFESMYPGFESRESHDFFMLFLSLLLQCKFANPTLLSLLRFSYFITPYDAQAFSALIVLQNEQKLETDSSPSADSMLSVTSESICN